MLKITNYKITPEQLSEIESHLEFATHLLNSEFIPDWEDLQTACRQIANELTRNRQFRQLEAQIELVKIGHTKEESLGIIKSCFEN